MDVVEHFEPAVSERPQDEYVALGDVLACRRLMMSRWVMRTLSVPGGGLWLRSCRTSRSLRSLALAPSSAFRVSAVTTLAETAGKASRAVSCAL
jgi:hypothetical protein